MGKWEINIQFSIWEPSICARLRQSDWVSSVVTVEDLGTVGTWERDTWITGTVSSSFLEVVMSWRS